MRSGPTTDPGYWEQRYQAALWDLEEDSGHCDSQPYDPAFDPGEPMREEDYL